MSCSSITLNGIGVGCKDNLGSIKEVYVIKKDDVVGAPTVTDGIITEIELKDSAKFSTYKFRKGTSSMSTSMETDEQAGTMAFTTDVSLQFSKLQTSTRLELMALAIDELVTIVLDGNGKYWFLGYDFPVTVTSMTANSGVNFNEFQGYTITLQDTSRELPFEVSATAIEGKINPAPIA